MAVEYLFLISLVFSPLNAAHATKDAQSDPLVHHVTFGAGATEGADGYGSLSTQSISMSDLIRLSTEGRRDLVMQKYRGGNRLVSDEGFSEYDIEREIRVMNSKLDRERRKRSRLANQNPGFSVAGERLFDPDGSDAAWLAFFPFAAAAKYGYNPESEKAKTEWRESWDRGNNIRNIRKFLRKWAANPGIGPKP